MSGVVVAVITKNNILATVDITLYESLKDLYEALVALKKDTFADDERIRIVYNSANQKKLIDELLLAIDIPDFFVIFETTDVNTGIDFSFSDSFCIYPWINLRISTTGDFSPCCVFNKKIANLSKTTIRDAYISDDMKDLRQRFLVGDRPNECSVCWRYESVGVPSMRQGGKHKFKEIYYRLDYQKENVNNLQLFDLNLGNACNLSCKICNRNSSSSIAEQDYANGSISAVEFQSLKQSMKWAESEEFWNQIENLIQNVKYLDLYGGEPLMSKSHFKFLKRIIELDVAKNIKIDYNSNGTVYSEHFFDLWQHFKEIKISFSIDDIGERFEQQRYGAKWNQVADNIKKFNSKRSTKFITEVYPTINTQNVFYLPELLDWIDTQSFDHAAFNILREPIEYNISSLNFQDKENIINKFKQFTHYEICNSIVKILETDTHSQKSRQNINNKV